MDLLSIFCQGSRKSAKGREGAERKGSCAYPICFSLLPNYKESAGILLFPISCRALKKSALTLLEWDLSNDFLQNIFLDLSKDNSLGRNHFLLSH